MIKKNLLNEKLNLILENQKKILINESEILKKEVEVELLEKKELKKEDLEIKSEEEALEELTKLESEIKKNVENPIKTITKKDVIKSFVGAFIGTVGHFAFYEGVHIAEELNFLNATILYFIAFLIVLLLLYYSGFRKIKKHIILKFLPLRAILIYSVSIVTIIFVYIIFGKLHLPINLFDFYKLISANIILAVLGAGTADLIGKSH